MGGQLRGRRLRTTKLAPRSRRNLLCDACDSQQQLACSQAKSCFIARAGLLQRNGNGAEQSIRCQVVPERDPIGLQKGALSR